MALGGSFYRAMTAGLMVGILSNPQTDYFDNTPDSVSVLRPWQSNYIELGSRTPAHQAAAESATVFLNYIHIANQYRNEQGPGAGAIAWTDVSAISSINSTNEIECSITTDDRTICVLSPPERLLRGAIAQEINNQHGLEIAGFFDGTEIVFPSGNTFSVPSGVSLSTDAFVVLREGK